MKEYVYLDQIQMCCQPRKMQIVIAMSMDIVTILNKYVGYRLEEYLRENLVRFENVSMLNLSQDLRNTIYLEVFVWFTIVKGRWHP